MSAFDGMTRRTALAGAVASVASPYVARAQALDQVKMSLEFRIYGGESVTRVAVGTHPFGLADASALVEFASRNPDDTPKLVMPVFDVFPAVILSIKKKITSLKDIAGLRVGGGSADAGVKVFPAILALNKIDPASFKRVTTDIKLRDTMLLTGDVDAVIAFDYTAIFNLLDNGVKMEDISLLYFSQMGFDFFGNSLIVNRDVAAKNPDLVKRMAIAVARSWVAASKDREGAIAAVMKREKLLNPKIELARMSWVIDKLIRTENVRKNGIGVIDKARVGRALDLIKEGFQLPTAPKVDQIVDDRFLPPLQDRQIG
jgi:NitT/TauT family transport system substrate-binding protein